MGRAEERERAPPAPAASGPGCRSTSAWRRGKHRRLASLSLPHSSPFAVLQLERQLRLQGHQRRHFLRQRADRGIPRLLDARLPAVHDSRRRRPRRARPPHPALFFPGHVRDVYVAHSVVDVPRDGGPEEEVTCNDGRVEREGLLGAVFLLREKLREGEMNAGAPNGCVAFFASERGCCTRRVGERGGRDPLANSLFPYQSIPGVHRDHPHITPRSLRSLKTNASPSHSSP